jgi:AcrR family transcriptional regulator
MAQSPPRETPRKRDSEATRARLLASARTEFAARGFAGARVDRIAAGARINKRMIYEYFGSKAGLFDRVVEATIDDQLQEVPFTPEDLPGYAVAYFDQLLAQPEALRLAMWRAIERVTASEAERDSFTQKIEAIRQAQAGRIIADDISAVDVLAMLFALTRSWLTATDALITQTGAPQLNPERVREHRAALELTVRRALTTQMHRKVPQPEQVRPK